MGDRIETIFRHLHNQSSRAVKFQNTASVAVSAPHYEYSLGGGVLTPQQRDSYEKNGFLVVKNIVSKAALEKYNQRFQEICEGKVKPPGITVMKDVAIAKSEFVPGQKAITKIQDYIHDDVLFDYCGEPDVLKYVNSFIGPNVMAMHTMLINKPPDPGTKTSRHPMHQDLHYFPFRPAERIVCAWTAMEHVHRGNGCLVVVPGTHKGVLLEHGYPDWDGGVNKLYHGIKNFDPKKNEYIHVEMDAGDTVFFHPILLHGSGTNTTKGFRKAISCHYAASESEYVDVRGTTQQAVIDEVKEVVEMRMGKEVADAVDYRDIWRMRSRLVSGKEINL